jgi:hypothetical protein
MIADIGKFAAAAVHPTMVEPAAPTHDKVYGFLASLDAAPSAKPTLGM